MLHPMPPPAQSSPSPGPSGFADLLASLASPASDAADRSSILDRGEFGDDVVTLSYEHALRNHARYRPADRGDWALTGNGTPKTISCAEAMPPAAVQAHQGTATHGDLRSESVTVRLSAAECARLRQRAAEAGITVSAYLRSCTFEVESLRAQVKQTLAELRQAQEAKKYAANEPEKKRCDEVRLSRVFGRIGRLWLGLSSARPS